MSRTDLDMDQDDESRSTLKRSDAPPYLPLPSLKETAESFTQWFTPFLTNEQRAETRTALNHFVKFDGLGALLQTELQSSINKTDGQNWLEKYWATRYLANREPIAVNDNFFFLFRHGETDRTKRAASLIAAALNYKLVLDQGQIPLAVERQIPTCELQSQNLFCTTRIPGEKQDSLTGQNHPENADDTVPSRHIVVFCRGNMFQLNLISQEGHPHALRDLEKGIEEIVESCLDEQPTGRSIGHLTGLKRANWARMRSSLIKGSQSNALNLQIIETALFTVHLEDHKPEHNLAASDQLMQGNSGNRWFDKALQFIIFDNGYAGLNVEHASLDRATIVDFLDYILGIDPASIDQYSGAFRQGIPLIKRLAFDLPPTVQKKITQAANNFEKLKGTTVSQTLEFTDFNAELLNKNHISPDAFAQCALQLAHFRLNQQFAAMGQNISMRHYTYGRVQTMWVVTSEMIEFVKVMLDPQQDEHKQFQALQKAAGQHKARTLECRKGDLPEQHFSELLNIYNRHPDKFQTHFITRFTSGGLSQQEISKALTLFKSPGWTCMHHDAFNTSFLASPTIMHQGARSPHRDNISLGCLIHNGDLNVYLCADQKQKVMLEKLVSGWQQALTELQALLSQNLLLPDIELDV